MNHQPFRDWLFSDEQLTTEQKNALREHLDTCQTCSQLEIAWTEVESAIHQLPPSEPAVGFATRWQNRLADYQQNKNKKRIWLGIGTSLLLGITLLILSISQILPFVQSPGQYLELWLNGLINVATIYFALLDRLHSISGSMIAYSLIGVVLLVGVASFMSVLWLATYRKLVMVRRTA